MVGWSSFRQNFCEFVVLSTRVRSCGREFDFDREAGDGKGKGGSMMITPFFELKADNFLKNNMLLEFYSCFSHRLSLKSILGGLPIAAFEHSGTKNLNSRSVTL